MLHRIRFTRNILVRGDTREERLDHLLRILSEEGTEPYALSEEAPEYGTDSILETAETLANSTIRKIV